MIFESYEGKTWVDAKYNLTALPINWMDATPENAEKFNEIYGRILDDETPKMWRTKSQGVSVKDARIRIPSYDIDEIKSGVQIIYLSADMCSIFRFRSKYTQDDNDTFSVSGKRGFTIFERMVKKRGGSLESIAIQNGKEVKASIEKPLIDLFPGFEHEIIEDAWHLDINSAYMAGIRKYCLIHAQDFSPDSLRTKTLRAIIGTINELYTNRKAGTFESRHYKSVLNVTQGFMQSAFCKYHHKGYALAHLSKYGVENCRNTIEEVSRFMMQNGDQIIAYNTDGFWFKTKNRQAIEHMYLHPSDELGKIKIDKHVRRIRFKSAGAYEYELDDGTYKPVVRGSTKLDYLKPRSEWCWGDIYDYNAEVYKFKFQEGLGLIQL